MLTAKYASTAKEAPKVVIQVKSAASPVFTLAVVSPLFTGVFTVLSTFDGVLGLAYNPAIAFSNVALALSTSFCDAFSFANTFLAFAKASFTT